jgi:prepilin-type N-terminal cleavage/methylation domain-containing protein
MRSKNQSAFSLIEIIIALAILGVLATISTAAFSNFTSYQALDKTKAVVVGVIHQVRSRAISSVNDMKYGVAFEPARVVVFAGDTYLPNDPGNQTINLFRLVVISSINLSPNTSVVVFEKRKGTASATGTITLSIPGQSGARVITLSKSGLAE